MEIVLIAAMASNRVIGKNDAIPWHIPEELRHFKTATMGWPLIMGRKTHQSIGYPLPGRKNIVITRDQAFRSNGCTIVHSIEDAIAACDNAEHVFVLGGEDIFRQTLSITDTILLTILDRAVDGDTFFPEFSFDQFQETDRKRVEGEDPYTIYTYRKVKQTD